MIAVVQFQQLTQHYNSTLFQSSQGMGWVTPVNYMQQYMHFMYIYMHASRQNRVAFKDLACTECIAKQPKLMRL